jgi:hypothetical protein
MRPRPTGLRSHRSFRPYHNASLIPYDLETLPDISSPHWSSEALVPIFDGPKQSIIRFTHARERTEQSIHGTQFLERAPSRALIHAANSVIGLDCRVRRGWSSSWATKGTAFEVGPGGAHSLAKFNVCSIPHS